MKLAGGPNWITPPYDTVDSPAGAPVLRRGFLVPPNGLRGSHCGAAAVGGLSLRARPCKMGGAADCSVLLQPGGRAGRAWDTGTAGSLVLCRMDRRDTRGALCGPRSTAPRAAPAPRSAGLFLRAAGQTICYHVHDGSYCDIGGVHELPSRQTGSVGHSRGHRPDCGPRIVRLAGRRDATSTVKHYLYQPALIRTHEPICVARLT